MAPAERPPGSGRSESDAHYAELAGVIGIGIDHFREVNATLGIGVADTLLHHAQRRLQELVSELLGDRGSVRRLPGPAFAVLVGRGPPAPIYRLAEQAAAALTDPFDTARGRIAISCSCGVVELAGRPAHAAPLGGVEATIPATIEAAIDVTVDAAIEAAKQLRRGGVLLYDPSRHGERSGTLELRAELRDALTDRRLSAAYQPVVSLDHSRVEGVETLARWHHPRLGPIAPPRFLTLIESPALAATLTESMLDAALAQLRRWRDDDVVDEEFYVSVNVPAAELSGPLHHLVQDLLERHGLDGPNLMLELTDATTAGDEASERTTRRLRDLGVSLALDDFGTAFAGLDRLLSWPVTCIKLDRSLIADVGEDHVAQALIAGVSTIAATLELALVAEGVEAAPQAEILRELAVPSAQGFLWSPPLAGEDATVWLHEYRHVMRAVPPPATA